MYNDGGKATLTNCTVSGNSATQRRWPVQHRGYYGGTATLTNCTVSGNSATVSGGGLFNATDSQYGAATATLTHLHRQRQLRRRTAAASPTRAR